MSNEDLRHEAFNGGQMVVIIGSLNAVRSVLLAEHERNSLTRDTIRAEENDIALNSIDRALDMLMRGVTVQITEE